MKNSEPESCPHSVKSVFGGWRVKPRKELVEEGRMYLVPTAI